MKYRDRLEYFREQIAKGPAGLTVAQWVALAGVSQHMVEPRYPSEISTANRLALAQAAADLVSWDHGQMEAWMVHGEDVPDLHDFLAELPNLARCAGPGCKGRWHKRSEIISRLSQCRACCRLLARQKRNPEADAIFDIAFQKLPQIRAVYPAFARALESCLSDRSRALTTARVQRIMCISRVRAEMLMKEHGLDKATVAVAAKSRCTFRCRFNRPGGQRRSTPFPRWAKEQNARWRRQAPAPNQIPLSLAGAA